MKLERSAISRVAVVAVLVVIVVVAVAAYYLTSAPPSGVTTAQTSTSAPFSSTLASTSEAATTPSSTVSATMGSTSVASTQTLSVTCPLATTNSSVSTILALIPQLNAYPSMTMRFSGNTSTMTKSRTFSFTYTVASVSSTTYTVNMQYVANKTRQFTAWLLKNGTTLAISSPKGNITGAQASSEVQEYFGDVAAVLGFVQDQSAYSNLFHANGTSTVTIGTNTFTVTNYVANALPETIQRCNGETTTITAYSLSEGTPSGSSYELPTYVDVAGSTTSNGVTTPFGFTVQITAFTAA